MREIPLTKGYFALVDDNDFDRVSQFKWRSRIDHHPDGSIRNVYATKDGGVMHRFILELTPSDPDVDHKDHNGLNNQRENLRKASDHQNHGNQRNIRPHKTSKFKGVCWHRGAGKWNATVCHTHLGYFSSEEAAARAYDAKARELFGEFAFTNF